MATPFGVLSTAFTGSVDPVADSIPYWQASGSQAFNISRNKYLGITGAPVGNSDSQTLTNKTITSPTISGPTLSGTILGTYTIGGSPTFPSNVVTLTGTQTLTNKVLTSPTINGGTISNTTITSDSIAGFTTANSGTIYGISVTSGTIGSAALAANSVTSTQIASGAVQPQALDSGTGTSWAWQTFTPTWTGASVNPVIGNGTLAGFYIQIGRTVFARIYLLAGSSTTYGTGTWSWALPVTSRTLSGAIALTAQSTLGTGLVDDVVNSKQYSGTVLLATSTTVQMVTYQTQSGANPVQVSATAIGSTGPITWGATDIVTLNISYEAAT